MASCTNNIPTKNYQNLISGFLSSYSRKCQGCFFETLCMCGGLAQLAAALIASTKLINTGPVSTWMGDHPGMFQPLRSTQPGYPSLDRCNEYQWEAET